MRDVCSLICLALIGLFRSRASLQAEILTLRHQLNLLRRKSPQRLTFISIDVWYLPGCIGWHLACQAGECCSPDRDARGHCRSRLLQQPGDPLVPRCRHRGNSTQAADVGCQIRWPLRQAGLCLFARGGRLSQEDGKRLRRYWTTACQDCSLKSQCTTGPGRRIPRWEHEHLIEAVQQRLDANPQAMRQRRETVEHPFGTMKARMGATHFLTKTLPKVAAEMALSVLAYNLTRVMNIIGIKSLIAAIRGLRPTRVFAPSTDVPLKPFLHDQDPKLTLIGGALQQLSPRGTRWLLEMTVARLPLGPEFSGITAYGADPVLPTNFVPTYNHAN